MILKLKIIRAYAERANYSFNIRFCFEPSFSLNFKRELLQEIIYLPVGVFQRVITANNFSVEKKK